MPEQVIILSGKVGSGKTTLAEQLVKSFNLTLFKTRTFLKKRAQGLPAERGALQDFGERLDTPSEWYELLNRKVFFWLTEERLETLLSAAAYRSSEHCVLTINTRSLLERHRDEIWLCPMNSGCTKPFPHPRSKEVFRRIADFPFEYWRQRKGGPRKAIVELAVDHAVLDVADFVELVTIRNQDGVLRKVWPSPSSAPKE